MRNALLRNMMMAASVVSEENVVGFNFQVSTVGGPLNIALEAGSSVIFVGANGAGKTRLAVNIEEGLGARAHRIAAHRALALNDQVPKIAESLALNGLRFGNPNPGHGASPTSGEPLARQERR